MLTSRQSTLSARFQPASIDIIQPIKPFLVNERKLDRFRRSVAIILLIEVRADGSVGDIDIKASSGDPRTDAAAVAYVSKLHWRPALRQGNATTMRILYSVTT